MAKSRNRGTPSSTSQRRQTSKALRTLNKLADSEIALLVQRALGAQADLHLVGGTVRDALSGKVSGDLDLASKLKPEQCKRLLRKASLRVVDTGIQHGTLTVIKDSQTLEITTFRKPARRDKNSYSKDIKTDLSGRDFTINALAFSLSERKLCDPFHGAKDLQQKILRAVGNPEMRFKEDPLRILRMVRFGAAQKRKVHKATLLAAKRLAPSLESVSIERIGAEFEKILMSADPAAAIRQIKDLGLLPLFVPELVDAVGFQQNKFHIHDVFEHTLWVLRRSRPLLELRLAALFHDVGKPYTLSVDQQGQRHFFCHEMVSEKICRKRMKALRFSKKLTERVCRLVRHHMRPLECGPSGARRIMRDLQDDMQLWRALKSADAPPRNSAKQFNKTLKSFDALVKSEQQRLAKSGGSGLAINGHDLIALGMKPGVLLGSVLRQLEELILEEPALNQKELLLEKARGIISSTDGSTT